jgi:hypothetical protein
MSLKPMAALDMDGLLHPARAFKHTPISRFTKTGDPFLVGIGLLASKMIFPIA